MPSAGWIDGRPPPSLVIRPDSGARITRGNMYVPYYNVSLHVRKRKGLEGDTLGPQAAGWVRVRFSGRAGERAEEERHFTL